MKREKKKERSKFKSFLIIYSIILAVIMVLFTIYVIYCLKDYERFQVDNYLTSTMKKVIDAGQKEKISDYLDVSNLEISNYEGKTASNAIANILNSGEITYKLNEESLDLNNPIYNVYLDNNLLFNVKLNGEEKVTELIGLLTIQKWKTEKIEFANNKKSFEYEIIVPENCTVYVNDIKISEKDQVEEYVNEELQDLAKYADVPHMNKYKISNLLKEPKIIVKDEKNNELEYTKENGIISVDFVSETIEDDQIAKQKIKGNIDPLKVATDWSLYLSNDLSGKLNGFYNINKYLIEDSYMWNYAYKWATNVDITFISKHTFDNPPFTNQKVSNFKIYNENAFSCEVYLEKNMIINRRGANKLQDVMNERMYFAYYNGEWKLVNMQSLTKNK